MDIKVILLSFLFLSVLNSEVLSQDFNYKKSIDDCYSSIDFQKKRIRDKHQKRCYIGQEMPDFEIYTMDGQLIDNKTIEGKVTVINFWFTACPPCIAEMPGLNQVVQKYSPDEVNFIGASTDSHETISKFVKRKGNFGFTLVADAYPFFSDVLYIQSGFPTTLVIDQDGMIQYFYAGGLADFRASRRIKKKLCSAIDDLLEL